MNMIVVGIIVLIVSGIMSIIQNRKRNTRIKELEKQLDEYYKRRENQLLKRFRDIEQQ